jgi:cytochrome c553
MLLACGWIPAASGAPPLDSTEQRVQPCTMCHGKEGRATNDGYYPRIAGKPGGYLFNQLVNFREGRRHFPMMAYLVAFQDERYLREMAAYFADQHLPYPAPKPPTVGADVLERGRVLVAEGDSALKIPSCRSCHGARLLGVEPAVPGLLGLSQDYLLSQLGAWRIGNRAALAPDCMAEIVRRLRREDLNAATAWLAAEPVPDNPAPESTFERRPLLDCGSIVAAEQPR